MTISENRRVVENKAEELSAISQRLLAARANAAALQEFPGQLPETLEDAYVIQSASISRWTDVVAGWKVGMVPEAFRTRLGAEPLAGPIFRSSILGVESGGKKSMPIFCGGFAAVEAEFMLEIGQTIEPTGRSYSDDELVQLVSNVYVGAEIASSPMAFVNVLGPCCVVSDFGNNAGLLVGPSIPDWSLQPVDTLTATVSIDDKIVGTANAGVIEGGLLQVLRYLIDLSATRGLSLDAGTLVSTGALTGIHEISVTSKAIVDFGPFGSFEVAFEPMQPRQ